MRFSINLYET